MAKGRRPTTPQSTPWIRWVGVLAGLTLAAALVWWVAKPAAENAGSTDSVSETTGPGPRPLDLEGGGPTVASAALVDVPAESLTSAGPDAPDGINVSNDPRLGNRNAIVTIVEFSDFQCPHCANFHLNTFPALRRFYGDEVEWIFVNRFFSAAHPMAERAAMAAECAHRQESFWEYAELIFANQENLSDTMLAEIATEAGLDEAAFGQCLASGETASEVAADQAEAARLQINATPTFFVNGQRIVGAQPLGVFNDAISPHFSR